MRIDLTRKENLTTKKWSGGTTTELFIYPKSSSYEQRNFNVRISTAECSDQSSIFTELPEIQRKLMVLKGKIVLRHDDQEAVELVPYKVDSFDGGARTLSEGTCTDFNLMLKGGYDGEILHFSLRENEETNLEVNCIICGIYILDGAVSIQDDNKEMVAYKGDFCVLSEFDNSKIILRAIDKKAEAVVTFISEKRR